MSSMLAEHLPNGETRRLAVRVGCNIPAIITFDGVLLCDAIIKDISTGGVRLFVPRKAWIPHEFEIKAHVFDAPVTVRRTWERGDYIGASLKI